MNLLNNAGFLLKSSRFFQAVEGNIENYLEVTNEIVSQNMWAVKKAKSIEKEISWYKKPPGSPEAKSVGVVMLTSSPCTK